MGLAKVDSFGRLVMDEVGPSNQEDPLRTSELGSDEGSSAQWKPRQLVFEPYSTRNEANRRLRVVVRRPVSSLF